MPPRIMARTMGYKGLTTPSFLFPALIGFAAAGFCLLTAGFTAWSLASAAFLPLAATAAGWHLSRLVAREIATCSRATLQRPALHEVCVRSFPVWARQIETTRREGDEAAHALTQL